MESFIKDNDIDKVYEDDKIYLLKIKDFDCLENIANNTNKEDSVIFNKLTGNLLHDKFCGSCLLGVFDSEKKMIVVISGNHRLKALKEAKISYVFIIVPKKYTKSDISRWHLSHNAIKGELIEDNLSFYTDFLRDKELLELGCVDIISKELKVDYKTFNLKLESFDEKPILADLVFYNDTFEDFKKKYEEANLTDGEVKIFTGISKEDFNRCVLYLKEKKNIFRLDQLLIKILEEVNDKKE